MLNQVVKNLSIGLLFTMSSLAQATTLEPITTSSSTHSVKPANDRGFIYPESFLRDEDRIQTSILFVYNDHILSFFDGDAERVADYVQAVIDFNNQAFINSNIPITRTVAGLIHADKNDYAPIKLWSNDDTYVQRLDALTNYQATQEAQELSDLLQYSYLVGLAGFEVLQGQMPILGLSHLSSNVSWISPHTTNESSWSPRTLAHELGHNDGFRHSSDDHLKHMDYLARHDATGHRCGDYASIMSISGTRNEPFFSDTEINLETEAKLVTCGEYDKANSAQVYRDLATTDIRDSQGTFSNLVAARENSGVVGVYGNTTSIEEGQSATFDVIFEGADRGDAVNLVVKKQTADKTDFESKIVQIIHNGIDDVYTVTVETYSDENIEGEESFKVELMFANGVSIDKQNATSNAWISDASVTSVVAVELPAQTVNNAQSSGESSSSSSAPATNTVSTVIAAESQTGTTETSGGSVSFFSTLLIALIIVRRKLKASKKQINGVLLSISKKR